jgi:hypothetical protein
MAAQAVYLVFLACLGSSCKPFELPVPVSKVQCMMGAHLMAAEWLTAHRPGWQLRHCKCEVGHPT